MAGLHLSKDLFGRFLDHPLPASKEYSPVTKCDTTYEIFRRFPPVCFHRAGRYHAFKHREKIAGEGIELILQTDLY